MAGLEISPTKIGYVIVKARECAAKVAAWDDGATSDHDAESILEWARKESTPRAKIRLLQGLAEGLADRFDPKAPPAKPADPSGQPRPLTAGP